MPHSQWTWPPWLLYTRTTHSTAKMEGIWAAGTGFSSTMWLFSRRCNCSRTIRKTNCKDGCPWGEMTTLTLSKITPIKLMASFWMNNKECIPNNRWEIRICQGSISQVPLRPSTCNLINPPAKAVSTISRFKPRASLRSNVQLVAQWYPPQAPPSWKVILSWGINSGWLRMRSTSSPKTRSLSCQRTSSRFSISRRCFSLRGRPSTTMLKDNREGLTINLLVPAFIRASKMLGSSIWCHKLKFLTKIQQVDLGTCHLFRIKSE